MQKQKENLFHEKFRLLNSQENTADIKWSSSSSSEYENTSCNEKFGNLDKNKNRKRKRKKKVQKNVSNLDITIIDSCKDSKSDRAIEKSPILVSKRTAASESPILLSSGRHKVADVKSPILCNKILFPKSPILNIKSASPNSSVRVKKKLLYEKNIVKEENNATKEKPIERLPEQVNKNIENVYIKSETSSFTESDNSLKSKLMEKVKNFFDSHFSSENTSQNISDTPTPTECSKGEDIDILSCRTQTTNMQANKVDSSDSSPFDKNTKKAKYKKGGLAHRLDALLKKQNAHISLWQHERFLAHNSNFVIPKEENVMFRIQTVDFKYGCYLSNVIDINNIQYFLIVHCKYVNTSIQVDSVLKLYEPYKILELDDECRIIVNVCKFECVAIKEQPY